MQFSEYQENSRNYQDYPHELGPFTTILGLMSSTGKLSNTLQPILNNAHGIFGGKEKDKITLILGDILFWLSATATDLGINMDDVAEYCIRRRALIKESKEKQKEKEEWTRSR